MVCLIQKQYESELKEYEGILGSREAAYYVLAANNGYTAEYTPDGKPSLLYLALLETLGSHEEAVIAKAQAYLPNFLEKEGNWIEDGSEPSFMKLLLLVSENDEENLFKDVFPKYADWYFKTSKVLSDNNITLREFTIDDMINISRSMYIKSEIDSFIEQNPDATEADIYNKKMSLREKWDSEKMSQIVLKQQENLAKAFGLTKKYNEDGSWYYDTEDESESSKLQIYFVNSLREGEWKALDGLVHQGVFVNKNGTDTAMNLIYISLMDGDITTITHELAHYYVRMFWGSEPVQTALSKLDYNGRQRSNVLEERLVDEIVSRITNTKKSTESFKNKIQEFISRLFHQNLSYNLREKTLDLLTTYFSLNKDLSDLKAERQMYQMSYQVAFLSKYINEDLPLMLIDVFTKISNGIDIRIKSLKSEVVKDSRKISELEEQRFKLDKLNNQDSSDVLTAILNTIDLAKKELLLATAMLYSIKNQGIEILNPKEFAKLKSDIIEYYRLVLLGNSINLLREHGELSALDESLQLAKEIDNIGTLITSLERVYDGILYDYCSYTVDKYADELVDVGNKEVWKVNAKMHLRNQIRHGQLMPLELWLVPASSSYSPLIRLIEYLNTEINIDVHQQTLKTGLRLFDLFNKAKQESAPGSSDFSMKNFFMNFIETDDKGNPTGYFISPRNVGMMKKRQREMEERLMLKYDVVREINERGQEVGFIFPDVNREIQFLDEHDREMDKISNRRYTADYYILRRLYLSKDTIAAIDYVDQQIRLLESRCLNTKVGLPDYSKLTNVERKKLADLQKEKDNLSSFYIIEQDSTGKIINFTKKDPSSDEYRIAVELNRWKDVVNSHIRYKPDVDRFNKDRDSIKNNMSPEALLWFDWFNSSLLIVMPDQNTLSPKERELYSRRASIINLCKPKKGFYKPKLELLNDDAIKELKEIDEQLYMLRISTTSNQNVNFESVYRMYGNQTYYDYFKNRCSSELEFYDKFYFLKKVIDKGNVVVVGIAPLSMFKDHVPQDPNMVQQLPIGKYNSVDKENSDWVNPDFDENYQERVLPKKSLFTSDKWNTLHDGKHQKMLLFFEALLKTKQFADSIIPYIDTNRTTKLALMTERSALLFLRNGLFKNLWSKIKGFFRNDLTINDRDTDYNEERMKRPDGSEINTIPIRWINDLKDPSTICTDLLGSTLAYYEMALTYQKRQDFAPLAETIALQLHGGISSLTGERPSTDQYNRLKKYIDMYVYGKLHSGFGTGTMSSMLKFLAKGAGNLSKLSHQKMMVHNWRTVLKNAVDSSRALFVEMLGGKYITYKDVAFALSESGKDFFYNPQTGYSFAQIRSLNGPKNISKTAAAMAYNKVDGTIYEQFSKLNENWLRRWLSNNFAMGEYTLVDYTSKGWITTAAYHNIRLVKMQYPDGTEKEMLVNEDQAAQAFVDAGFTAKFGRKKWSESNFTLWDCYTVNLYGGFELLNQYLDLVRPLRADGTRSRKIETRVAGTIRELSGIINGVLPSEDRAGLSLNWAGSLLLLLRGWLVMHTVDAFKSGSDFRIFKNDKQEGSHQYQKLLNMLGLGDLSEIEDNQLDGQYSFLKGTVDKGWLRPLSLIRAYKSLLHTAKSLDRAGKLATTSFQKYQVRKFTTYMSCMAFLLGMTVLTGKWVEKDPDGVLSNFAYSVNLSTAPESISMMSPMTLIDLVKNPTAAYSYIDDFDSSLQLLADGALLGFNTFGLIDDSSYDEIINTGSYKGLSKGERTLLKASSIVIPEFGFNNIYKNIGWTPTRPTEFKFNSSGHRAYQRWNQRVFPNNIASYKAQFKRGRPKKSDNNLELNLDLDLSLDLNLDLDLSK